VWDAVVDYATTQAVDAVALTGDIVDRDNRFFESYGPLSRGLSRLADAGIDTFAVAGNHDFSVFPHLVDTLDADRFHFLGRGGAWDTASLVRNGEEVIRFVGWSFPQSHVRNSPVDTLSIDASEVPTIGLLHGDLDQEQSDYAPVTRSALAAQPVDAWLLGHIHKPMYDDGGSPLVLYPGSPQPLDPGEKGSHGPWRIEVSSQRQITAQQVPLASVRYDTIDVKLDDVADEGDFRAAVVKAVESAAEAHAENDALRHVSYRLRCTGRTSIHRQLDTYWHDVADLEVRVGDGTAASVEALIVETQPDVDLRTLSHRSDPPGVLAQTILDLQANSGAHDELLQDTLQELSQVNRARKYGPLRRAGADALPNTPQDAREMLIRQGLQLLDELLAQKDADADE
jgi:DNA repair exonuclease SbcCD nuclease subunit